MAKRVLATNTTDYASGALGLVEVTASHLNDRSHKAWSKPELILWLNQEQRSIAREINKVYRDYFISSATTPTVSGQSTYSLPADMAELVKLEVVDDVSTDVEPQDLVEIELEDKRFYEVLEQANKKINYGFFFIAGDNFTHLPSVTSSAEFFRLFYVQLLTDMVSDTDVTGLPEQHEDLLCIRAARMALAKFGRVNRALEQQNAEKTEGVRIDVRHLSRNKEERRRPWRGSYGPTPPIQGRIF